jgi:uncharacterized protein (DUF1778 family)
MTLDKSVTEFVLESASTAAEQVLADRRWFELHDANWEAFQAALEAAGGAEAQAYGAP